jgi:hypothetical protein
MRGGAPIRPPQTPSAESAERQLVRPAAWCRCLLRDGEYYRAESDRHFAFLAVNKRLTWRLVGPHSCSLFSGHLDGPPDAWVSLGQLQYIDWPVAQTWRRALDRSHRDHAMQFQGLSHTGMIAVARCALP